MHIKWLRENIKNYIGLNGHITKAVNSSVYQLKYAKNESLKLIEKIYYSKNVPCLERKRKKIYNVATLIG